jgi:signal peptidase II
MPEQKELPLQEKAPITKGKPVLVTGRWWRVRRRGLAVAVLALVVDVLTKQLALAMVHKLPVVLVPGLFNLTFAWNRGISFSFLQNVEGSLSLAGLTLPPDVYMPAALSLVALVAIGLFLWWLGKEVTWAGQGGIGLILGGAAGNLVDRLSHGAVVDFLHVYYQNWHFPVFNMADSFITVGVVLLIWDGLRQNTPHEKKDKKADA